MAQVAFRATALTGGRRLDRGINALKNFARFFRKPERANPRGRAAPQQGIVSMVT